MDIFEKSRTSKPVISVIAFALLAAVAMPGQVATKTWTLQHTPDGQPDLEGYWSNVTITPLERPAELAGKAFFTEQELSEREKKAEKPRTAEQIAGTIAHYDFAQYGLDITQTRHSLNLRTSLIVDPPDGKIPPMTPEARKRAAENAEARKKMGGPYDGPESRGLGERCIYNATEGPPMLPPAYNANLQIQQGPGYVAILQEEIHDVRIIPLDGRPHLGPNIRQYLGDSRGHWEGNTLVVDVTNFNNRTNFRGSSENLHVIERFTRIDEDTILYEFTVDDPTTWTRPWKAELPMAKIKGPIYEYACHEGNFDMVNNLSQARALEKKAAEEKANAAKENLK
jgi:hypothetical protein